MTDTKATARMLETEVELAKREAVKAQKAYEKAVAYRTRMEISLELARTYRTRMEISLELARTREAVTEEPTPNAPAL